MAKQSDTKSYGLYTYTGKGKTLPFYLGKDSHINEGTRDRQHRSISQPKSIIDKALASRARGGLVYTVIAKFPDSDTMALAEAVLIDYYHKRGACTGNIVNELYSRGNKNVFGPGYTEPVTVSTPTHEAKWIKKRQP